MKTRTLLIAAVATVLSAQALAQDSSTGPPAARERATTQAQARQQMQNRSEEDRAQALAEREQRRAEHRAQWQSMNEEQRAAVIAEREQRRAENRARWQSMTDEERAAVRTQMREHRQAQAGAGRGGDSRGPRYEGRPRQQPGAGDGKGRGGR